MRRFLTEVKKFFLIHNTESLFVQWEDYFVCVYKSGETLIRDEQGLRLHKKHICESQFKFHKLHKRARSFYFLYIPYVLPPKMEIQNLQAFH